MRLTNHFAPLPCPTPCATLPALPAATTRPSLPPIPSSQTASPSLHAPSSCVRGCRSPRRAHQPRVITGRTYPSSPATRHPTCPPTLATPHCHSFALPVGPAGVGGPSKIRTMNRGISGRLHWVGCGGRKNANLRQARPNALGWFGRCRGLRGKLQGRGGRGRVKAGMRRGRALAVEEKISQDFCGY